MGVTVPAPCSTGTWMWTCLGPAGTSTDLSSVSPCSKNLTWRDMQHLVVQTSKPAHLNANDWVTNGVGRKGTGMLDQGLPVPHVALASGC